MTPQMLSGRESPAVHLTRSMHGIDTTGSSVLDSGRESYQADVGICTNLEQASEAYIGSWLKEGATE